MAGLRSGEGCIMIDSVVWAQYINVTDRQPRRHSKCRDYALRRAAKMPAKSWVIDSCCCCPHEAMIVAARRAAYQTTCTVPSPNSSCGQRSRVLKQLGRRQKDARDGTEDSERLGCVIKPKFTKTWLTNVLRRLRDPTGKHLCDSAAVVSIVTWSSWVRCSVSSSCPVRRDG